MPGFASPPLFASRTAAPVLAEGLTGLVLAPSVVMQGAAASGSSDNAIAIATMLPVTLLLDAH